MKKKRCGAICRGGWKKVFFMLRITVIFIFTGLMQVSASVYSQQITLNANKTSITNVLKLIENQSDFHFLNRSDIFDGCPEVTIEVQNVKLEDVLNILIVPYGFAYEIDDRTVVIKRASPANNPIGQPQRKKITGIVKDSKGVPLPGVSIVVKGTTIGTVTDVDGQFRLMVPIDAKTVVFSFIGMVTQEIAIDSKTVINIILQDQTVGLEEVVAVGYGVQKKESVVGAITQIGTDALVHSGTMSVTNAITGKLSGVLTKQQSGEPGKNYASIVIRGLSSWNGSQPLIMVDGVERDFRDLDPNEVKTISVLKDASATAIFGARGANGVILVTTKRGVIGKPKMNFSWTSGIETTTRLPEHVDSYTVMSMLNVSSMNDQRFSYLVSDKNLEEYRNPSSPLNAILYPDNDWYKIMTKKAAPYHNANLNISGGNNFARYFVSLGYTSQSDFFKNTNEGFLDSRYWYRRLNYRANVDFNLTRSTVFSVNLGGDLGFKNQPGLVMWQNLENTSTSGFPAYYPDWLLNEIPDPNYPDASGIRLANAQNSFFGNPYNYMVNPSFQRYTSSKIFSDLIIDQKLDFFTEGLSFKGKASMNTYFMNNSLNASYNLPEYILQPTLIGTNQNPWIRQGASDNVYVLPPVGVNIGSLSSDYYRNMYFEASLNYSRNFGNHNTSGLLLVNRQQNNLGTDFPYYYQGLVGRATYNYKSKYLLEGNIGYTGSERFAPGNRYGFFPAIAVGYVVSEEKFFKNALPWMNKLKFRFSEGLVGSDAAANRWLYISNYTLMANQIYEDNVANPTAQWEEALKRNLGMEFSIFNNQFTASIEVFDEQRSKMLLIPRNVTFLVASSFKELNIGKLKKHGLEVEVEFNKTTAGGFNYFVKGLFGWNENRVVFKDDLPYAFEYQRSAGKPLDAVLNGVELAGTGYLTSVDDIHNSISQASPNLLVLGDYKYLDYNTDGKITGTDRHPVKGSTYAPITYSLSGGFAYKGFDFNILFEGVKGKYVSFAGPYDIDFVRDSYLMNTTSTNYWRPDNPSADHMTIHWANPAPTSINWLSVDPGVINWSVPEHSWRNANYLRLKTIYASYRIKSGFLANMFGIPEIVVNVTANNLFTWTPLILGDPEKDSYGNYTSSPSYPMMRSFTAGLNFPF